jgi:hypothetical protein
MGARSRRDALSGDAVTTGGFGTIANWLKRQTPLTFSAYCIVAAFTTYFCMYGFRKPFSAGEFADEPVLGIQYKTILVAAQMAGYALSKFIGIKVISEMPPARRGIGIIALIAIAQLALLGFGLVPPPYNWVFLFLNGLPLGMVFGLVLSFLEGRQVTEALTAGLCASFILASGVVKSVGRSLIVDFQVSEYWMPFVTGLLFLLPLLVGVYLLCQIPRPTERDVELRSARPPMTRDDRRTLFRRHAIGLSGLVLLYVLLTIIRSVRDDFAVEIWQGLDESGAPSIYAWCELWVTMGVLAINGSAVFIRDNRRAFFGSFGLIAGGFLLVVLSSWGHSALRLPPLVFMVAIGVGTYVPYVAFHTTVFERMLALFRERGNIGYLMYLADATGYLGTVGVLIAKDWLSSRDNFLHFFKLYSFWMSIAAIAILGCVFVYYARALRPPVVLAGSSGPLPETA